MVSSDDPPEDAPPEPPKADPPEIPEEVKLQAMDAVGPLANSFDVEDVDPAGPIVPLDTPDIDGGDAAPIYAEAELTPDTPGGEPPDPGLGPFPVEEVDPADPVAPLNTPDVDADPTQDLGPEP